MAINGAEELFLRTLDDLETRAAATDPYEVLGLSALVRKLFLDDHPLWDQVNRSHRHKLILRISDPDSPYTRMVLSMRPSFYSVQDGLDPDSSRPGKVTIEVNRDKFFSTVVMVIQGASYSVKDVVLFAAHVMGGVHVGAPKSERERVLQEVNNSLGIGGMAASLRQLRSIAMVLLKGMAPVRDTLREAV
jgi:hypothetical protein